MPSKKIKKQKTSKSNTHDVVLHNQDDSHHTVNEDRELLCNKKIRLRSTRSQTSFVTQGKLFKVNKGI
jgi:hypothetical protein